jgi:hypothetical protein
MDDMRGPGWHETPSFLQLLGEAPTFIRFLGEESVRRMLAEFGDLPLSFRHETWGSFTECAVLNREASKKNALAALCAGFQIPADRVLAIGDSRNDVPMLRWAKIGVAMANALPEVRQAVHATKTNCAPCWPPAIGKRCASSPASRTRSPTTCTVRIATSGKCSCTS